MVGVVVARCRWGGRCWTRSAWFEIMGRIVRVMMFEVRSDLIGMVGWMLRMLCVPLSGPKLRLVLSGMRLIRLPTWIRASSPSPWRHFGEVVQSSQ